MMTKDDYMEWLFTVIFSVIGLCVSVFLLKLTSDFYTAPNIFIKEPVVQQTQKQVDEQCVAWWFNSNLTEAKKRVCGK
jgi:hypothetical protein